MTIKRTFDTETIFGYIKRDFPKDEVINRNAYENRTRKGTMESYLLGNVGYCVLSRIGNSVLIVYIAIHPDFRGNGYGSTYLRLLSDGKSVFVEVDKPTNETNERRIRFYESNGFHVADKKYSLFGKGMWLMSNDESCDCVAVLSGIYERMIGSRYLKCIRF